MSLLLTTTPVIPNPPDPSLFTLDLCRYGALLIQPGQKFEFDAPVPLPGVPVA